MNFFRLYAGYHYSKLRGKPVPYGMPFFVSIEPTTACNLRCTQCPSGLRSFTRPTGMLSPELFRTSIDQLSRHLHSLTFYFQGEPYLNPDFTDMVSYASQRNIYTITSTNGHFLNKENSVKTVNSGLDKLIISLDGTDQETYEAYRVGGNLDKVIAGTKEILKQRKIMRRRNPHVVWQFVVFKQNEHQVPDIKKMAREAGVDQVTIKTAQIYDFENGHSMIPDSPGYSRYKGAANGKLKIKNELRNHCWRMWQGCVITWDGKVVPCCFDKDAHYKIGNLRSESFATIWRSEPYQAFRRSVIRSRKEIDICANCSEGTKVWA